MIQETIQLEFWESDVSPAYIYKTTTKKKKKKKKKKSHCICPNNQSYPLTGILQWYIL